MKLTVVGSSHGVPEAHRGCTCLLLASGSQHYFVDMGSSGMNALRKRGIPVESVQGVFITHMHGDHINGLVEFVDLCTWYFTQAKPVICLPMPEAGEIIRQWTHLVAGHRVQEPEFRKTVPGQVYTDDILSATAIATQHCDRSHAYLIECEGKRVLFTGDLRSPLVDFPQVEGKIDLLVCESAHFPATDYLSLLTPDKVGQVLITHYSDKFLSSCLSCQQTLVDRGIPTTLATDDLELTL